MFFRASALSVLALTVLAAATPAQEKRWGSPPPTTVTVTAPGPTKTVSAGNCNTGPIQCCQQVQSANSAGVSTLLGLLGVVVSPLTALVGLGCSPISVIGVGSGSACNAHPVCCQNNAVGGLLSIGCIPVSL